MSGQPWLSKPGFMTTSITRDGAESCGSISGYPGLISHLSYYYEIRTHLDTRFLPNLESYPHIHSPYITSYYYFFFLFIKR